MIPRPVVDYLHERGVRDGTSVRRTFGPDGGTKTTRRVWCPWLQQDECILRHLGAQRFSYAGAQGADPDSVPDNVLSVTGLERLVPLPDPQNPRLLANAITAITGHKQDDKFTEADGSVSAVYARAEIEVVYEPVDFDAIPDEELKDDNGNLSWPDGEWNRYTTITEPSPSVEYLTMPGGTLKYIRQGGGQPHGSLIPFNVGKVLPILEFHIIHRRLPFDVLNPFRRPCTKWFDRVFGNPDTGTSPMVGTVNKTKFLNYPAGTLLLANVKPVRSFGSLGQLQWDMDYTMAYDQHYWNFKYYHNTNSAYAGWYLVGRGDTYYNPGDGTLPAGYSIYDETEFRNLFRFHV